MGRPTDGMLTHVIDPALLLTPYGHRNYLVPSLKLAKNLLKNIPAWCRKIPRTIFELTTRCHVYCRTCFFFFLIHNMVDRSCSLFFSFVYATKYALENCIMNIERSGLIERFNYDFLNGLTLIQFFFNMSITLKIFVKI